MNGFEPAESQVRRFTGARAEIITTHTTGGGNSNA